MKTQQKGSVLIMALILIIILETWSLALCSLSGVNLQIARNQKNSNRAFAAAESGLSCTRRWMFTDVNNFAGIHYSLSPQSSFIVGIELTADPNVLTAIVIGKAREFYKTIGGDFRFDSNSWRWDANSYFEN